MRSIILLACLYGGVGVCLLTGCKDRKNDVLSPEIMKVVLWDMLRADEIAMSENMKDTVRTNYLSHSVNAYQQVFAIHNTTKEQFYRSLRYYQEHPDKNKILIDSVQALGNRMKANQDRKDSIDQVAKMKLDSIKLKQDSAKLKNDTAKLKADTAKLKQDTAKAQIDPLTIKTRQTLPKQSITQPLIPRSPLSRARRDSLIKARIRSTGAGVQKPIN